MFQGSRREKPDTQWPSDVTGGAINGELKWRRAITLRIAQPMTGRQYRFSPEAFLRL
jgi:hypothetical protein